MSSASENMVPEPGSPRARVCRRFAETLSNEGGFLVGAAVGAGITAQAAEAGGADFILAISAGRMRIMGAPSLVATLPVFDSNRFVLNFARGEILSQCTQPVFFCASVMNPQLDIPELIGKIVSSGFHGVANWPTSLLYSESYQALMERVGIGFSREIELLVEAQSQGLAGLAAVRTRAQAMHAARAGVDAIWIQLGWNSGGMKGVRSDISLEEAAGAVRAIARVVARIRPQAICLLEGGPVETAEQVGMVCRGTQVRGYVGGSTLDRLPVEESIAARTISFKKSMSTAARAPRDSDKLRRWGRSLGLIGGSAGMLDVYSRIRVLADSAGPALLSGETGTPTVEAARAIHLARGGVTNGTRVLPTRHMTEQQIRATLFGIDTKDGRRGALAADDTVSVIIQEVERLSHGSQARLARYIESGRFSPLGSRRRVHGHARVYMTSPLSLDRLESRGAIHDRLARSLERSTLTVPPLRERIEDLELIVGQAAARPGREWRLVFSPTALRRLMAYEWPDNDTEAREFAQRLLAKKPDGPYSLDDVDALFGNGPARAGTRLGSERDLILDALWRHKFHRERTAAYLGISRKTLYNKIQRYGLAR